MSGRPCGHCGPHVQQRDVPDLCECFNCTHRRLAHAAAVAMEQPAVALQAPAPTSPKGPTAP